MEDLDHLAQELIAAAEATAAGVSGVGIVVVDGRGAPFSLRASSRDVAALDVVQFAEGGPSVDAAGDREVHHVEDTLTERRWDGFPVVAAGHDVRSILALPIADGDRVVVVTLHAGDPGAFVGGLDAARVAVAPTAGRLLAALDARGDVTAAPVASDGTGADLAEEAAGLLAAARGLTVERARTVLPDAAARAGVDVATAARTVLGLD